MSVAGTITYNVRMDSENYLSATDTISSDSGYKTSDLVANGTGVAVAIPAFLTAKCEGLYFSADEDITLTLVGTGNANNTTFNITADEAVEWHNGSGITCPVGNNCISANVDNASGNNATLTGRIWVNA